VLGELFGKYFLSEWSMLRAKFNDRIKYATFSGQNNIIVITRNGNYAVFELPKEGRHCKLIDKKVFFVTK